MADFHRYTERSRRSSLQSLNDLLFETIQKECKESKILPSKLLLSSTVLVSTPQPSKRKRKCSQSQTRINKKKLIAHTIELFDESDRSTEFFRCYSEEEVIPDTSVQDNIIQSLMDDDCETDEEQVKLAVRKVKKQILKVL